MSIIYQTKIEPIQVIAVIKSFSDIDDVFLVSQQKQSKRFKPTLNQNSFSIIILNQSYIILKQNSFNSIIVKIFCFVLACHFTIGENIKFLQFQHYSFGCTKNFNTQ